MKLRPAEPRDHDFLVGLVNHEETRPFLGSDVDVDVDNDAWFVGEADGERVGCVMYVVLSEQHRIVEARRFAIDPRLRGRGYGVTLARAFQRHVLQELGFHRIELKIYGFNEAAIAHAEAAGYKREGVKRRAYLKNGEWTDAVLFALLAEDLDAGPEEPPSAPRQAD